MSLPHRSPDPLALTTIAAVARRAEELGFRDLWVTENMVDDGTCVDPVVALTYAAAITRRLGGGAGGTGVCTGRGDDGGGPPPRGNLPGGKPPACPGGPGESHARRCGWAW